MNKNKFLLLLISTLIFLLGIYHYSDTNIYIIRHGEKVIKEGVSDAPLTKNGKLQAQELGKYLSTITDIPKLYSSPMRRARETAEIIALQTKSSISFDDRLTEKNYRKSEKLYPDGSHIYVKFLPNGEKETKEQHLERFLNFLKDKIRVLDKDVYIVGHGGLILRSFEKIASDNNKEIDKHKIPYCSVFIFKYNKITKSLKYINNFLAKKEENGSAL